MYSRLHLAGSSHPSAKVQWKSDRGRRLRLPDLLPLPFSDPPDLLGWEAFGPFGGYRAVNAGRGLGCSDLDVVDDVEADVVEQSNPRRDRQVELDAARLVNGVAPVQSPQIKVGAFQTFGHRCRTVDR
jgi:hypothetical protein